MQARYVRAGQLVNGKPRDLAESAQHHLAYIEREGVERDGSAGRLYTTGVAAGAPTREALRASIVEPVAGEKHQFRFIVSPEDAHELDMTEFIRELMQRVERDLGQPLIWVAVNHYNTAHPHAHVVIRGVDRVGREVRFDRNYIAQGFRRRAEQLATERLGPRSDREHQAQLEREITQHRFTTLDRQLAVKARAHNGMLRHADLDDRQRRRVATLEALGLVSRVDRGSWRFSATWERTLRTMGERHDIIKRMHRAMREVDSSRYVIAERELPTSALEGDVVYGRVAALGLRDDTPNGMWVVVETARGSGYHILLTAAQASELRENDLVSLRRWKARTGQHRFTVDRHAMRLEQQVTYLGPTWLDHAQPSGTTPFAQKVVRLRAERTRFLKQRELEHVDLRSVERRRIASAYAKKRGKKRAARLDGFRGRVVTIHTAPSGGRYAIVENDHELVAVRANASAQQLRGRDVRIAARDHSNGRNRTTTRRKKIELEPIEHERG